jgi:hypothetical protein
MFIYNIKLAGKDHKLVEPIEFIEEDVLMSGKRMIKMYNNDFHLLSYSDNRKSSIESMKESINLIINSVLFEPDWIPDDPMPQLKKTCEKLKKDVNKHVYG